MSQMPSLSQLRDPNAFLRRHLGPDAAEQQAMLDSLGLGSRVELIEQTVPPGIRLNRMLDLPPALDEEAALAKLRGYAEQNQVWTSLIGMGYHGTLTPTVILRNVLENPGWYTAYTPYQPEIAQGRLEALLNFQQLTIDLTGLELANASLLDEATAAAEAMALAKRVAKSKSNVFFVDENCHPQTISVVQTRAEGFGFELVIGPVDNLQQHQVFGALLQYPDTHGEIRDLRPLIDHLHAQHALACVAADLLSLLLLTPPGELGADVVFGSSQRFGVPMGYGGPHAAFFASRDEYKRAIPGRIIGVSKDARGNVALRMALQTREQHIRREKANSNICTAQVLLANIASFYAVYHGPEGLKRIAQRVHRLTCILAAGLERKGLTRVNQHFFDTLTLDVGGTQTAIIESAQAAQINVRILGRGRLGLSLDETSDEATVAKLFDVFLGVDHGFNVEELDAETLSPGIPGGAGAHLALSASSGIQRPSQRNRDAALPQAAGKQRPGAQSIDDPVGLLHHETQCHQRDDPDYLAAIRQSASVRTERAGSRLCADDRRTGALAVRDHRFRCDLHATQLRCTGRVRRVAGHPQIPREPASGGSGHLPDSVFRSWHQPGFGADGRDACGHCRVRRGGQR